MFLTYLLTSFLDISSGIFSRKTFGIFSGILSDISSGISSDVFSGIFFAILSGVSSGMTYLLTYLLAFFLPNLLTLCSGISPYVLSGILLL